MARTRWPPICETPASCPGQADRPGGAGGCLNDRDPGDGPVSRQPRWGVRPDNRSDQVPAPTLRPQPPKTTEAGPKLSPTPSLPTLSLSRSLIAGLPAGADWPDLRGFVSPAALSVLVSGLN